mmetsp:Transcript_11596/g.22916  ORF Transcript_11596/g.22916 Transcript_11596/m.22916 type:complete len:240 (-) Transcript_11596:114-833(-)
MYIENEPFRVSVVLERIGECPCHFEVAAEVLGQASHLVRYHGCGRCAVGEEPDERHVQGRVVEARLKPNHRLVELLVPGRSCPGTPVEQKGVVRQPKRQGPCPPRGFHGTPARGRCRCRLAPLIIGLLRVQAALLRPGSPPCGSCVLLRHLASFSCGRRHPLLLFARSFPCVQPYRSPPSGKTPTSSHRADRSLGPPAPASAKLPQTRRGVCPLSPIGCCSCSRSQEAPLVPAPPPSDF